MLEGKHCLSELPLKCQHSRDLTFDKDWSQLLLWRDELAQLVIIYSVLTGIRLN